MCRTQRDPPIILTTPGDGRDARRRSVARKLDLTRVLLTAAAVVAPGLAVVGIVGLATGRLRMPGPLKSGIGSPSSQSSAPAAGDPFASVGAHVRELWDAKKRGRVLARETWEFVAEMEKADRFPALDFVDRSPASRKRVDDASLGVFTVEAVRAGRQGIALAETLEEEMIRRRRLKVELDAADQRARQEQIVAEERTRVEAERKAREEQDRLAREEARRSARRAPPRLTAPRPTTHHEEDRPAAADRPAVADRPAPRPQPKRNFSID